MFSFFNVLVSLMFCRAKDEEAGEVPMAFVLKKQGSMLSEAAVIDYVAKQVPSSFNSAPMPSISLSICSALSCSTKPQAHGLLSSWQVAPYKKVRKVMFTHSIPRSAAGKILRRELRGLTSRI